MSCTGQKCGNIDIGSGRSGVVRRRANRIPVAIPRRIGFFGCFHRVSPTRHTPYERREARWKSSLDGLAGQQRHPYLTMKFVVVQNEGDELMWLWRCCVHVKSRK